MRNALIILFLNLVCLQVFASDFSHFPSCNEPLLVVGTPTNANSLYGTDFFCEQSSPLPSLGEMDDFIEDFQGQTRNQNNRLSFLSELQSRLKFITRANKTKLEMQKRCFTQRRRPQGCEEVRAEILAGIQDNWHEMSLSMVLGFQENSAVRYQFGASQPDLFQFPRTKHPFGGRVEISDEIRAEANQIFDTARGEFGDTIDSGLRDHLQQTYSRSYTEALSRAPIMAMLDSPTPSDSEVASALSQMIENNEDILEKEFDASELAGFYPLMNDLVLENSNYCTMAEHLVNEKLQRDDNNRYLQIGAAGVLGAGCLASAWTGVGMSLCFASGTVLTGTNIALSTQNANLERMRAFTSAVDNQLVSDFDALSAAEQNQAMELMMAPLAGFGAGSFLRAVAPSTRVLNLTNRLSFLSRTQAAPAVALEDLRQVPSGELNLLLDTGVNANGRHFVSDIADLQVATRNGERVMVKSHHRADDLLDEAAMYELVEASGIRTPYQGVATLPDGSSAIVSEFVEGGVFKSTIGGYKFFPNTGRSIADYNIGQHTIDGLAHMENRLRAANISPGDFQVFIKPNGHPVLFDVDLYSRIPANANPEINHFSNIQELREGLQRYIAQ